MSRTNFESLRVYKLSENLADSIWEIATSWDEFARSTIARQIVRAADSIGANKGCGRGTYQDNRRFVRTARGSLNEPKHFLRRAFQRGLLTAAQTEKLKPIIDELSPKLNGYLQSIGSN